MRQVRVTRRRAGRRDAALGAEDEVWSPPASGRDDTATDIIGRIDEVLAQA